MVVIQTYLKTLPFRPHPYIALSFLPEYTDYSLPQIDKREIWKWQVGKEGEYFSKLAQFVQSVSPWFLCLD